MQFPRGTPPRATQEDALLQPITCVERTGIAAGRIIAKLAWPPHCCPRWGSFGVYACWYGGQYQGWYRIAGYCSYKQDYHVWHVAFCALARIIGPHWYCTQVLRYPGYKTTACIRMYISRHVHFKVCSKYLYCNETVLRDCATSQHLVRTWVGEYPSYYTVDAE